MEVENRKLVYQVFKVGKSSSNSQGLVYYKMFRDDYYNIWARRAFKKGYIDKIEDTSEFTLFKINEKGINLLKSYPEFTLHIGYNGLKNNNIKERRKLRQLRLGSNK